MLWRAAFCWSVVALGGCAPEFEPQSKIQSLRVMAVQKDQPYARPGEVVKLSMLLADDNSASREAPPAKREVDVRWIGGCENPLGDQYAGCFAELAEGDGEGIQYGYGLEFQVQISPDIISRRPAPANAEQPPYGLAYVFFAACAGRFDEVEDPDRFPIGCVDDDGVPLGSDDFVAGYTAIFAYDSFENKNPVVRDFTIDGERVKPECVNQGCVEAIQKELGIGPSGLGLLRPGSGGAPTPMPGDAGGASLGDAGLVLDAGGADVDAAGIDAAGIDAAGIDAAGIDAGEPSNGEGACTIKNACLQACPEKGECREYEISLEVNPSSAEIDSVAEARGDSIQEQMWINYYVEDGEIDAEVTLLNDATTGFNVDHGTTFTVPRGPTQFHVWAVAHDNRGGASWARLRLRTAYDAK